MQTVTAIVHTKNSGKTLEACLASLSWCDEIFVVDMCSSDDTIAIAKKFKTTIFREEPISFADPVRDAYMRKVRSDWTLIVDSDEEVSPGLSKLLKERTNVVGIQGYRIPRANIIFGKWMQHTGFWPDYIVRFFQTGSCTYPPYVHSQPIVEGKVLDIEPKKEYAIIHHHYDSIEQYLMRVNVYTTLEVEKRAQQKIAPDLRFFSAFFNEFFFRFFSKEGYKDGYHGLVVSFLQAIYMLVVSLKAWESAGKPSKDLSLDAVADDITIACDQSRYWVANQQIADSGAGIRNLYLRCIRKLHS